MKLIEIIKKHAEAYPCMQPQDVIKLIYQNEFGGGHLIKDETQSLIRIQQECTAFPVNSALSLFEDIGNGLVRVHLTALPRSPYTPEDINRAFIRSSALHKGSLTGFVSKIYCLSANFDAFSFSFSEENLSAYLTQYEKDGFPMVSHSDIYRKNYRPAYRVIQRNTL